MYVVAAEQAKGGKQREGCCELVRENPIRQTKPTQGEPVECFMEPRAQRGKGVALRCSDYPSTLYEVGAELEPSRQRVVSSGKGLAS